MRLIMSVLVGLPVLALASDHKNLEEGLPVTVEDAYPVAWLGREVQGLLRYERTQDGKDDWLLEGRLEYGFARNWQGKLSVPWRFGNAEKESSGNLRAELFHNFNQESLSMPALALSLEGEFPTGVDSEGIDTKLKLIASKTLGRSSLYHRLHLNAAWKRIGEPGAGERRDLLELVAGYDRRLRPNTHLVADVVYEEQKKKGEAHWIAEVGVRQQISPLTVVALGVGAGLNDDAPRYRVTLGVQRSF